MPNWVRWPGANFFQKESQSSFCIHLDWYKHSAVVFVSILIDTNTQLKSSFKKSTMCFGYDGIYGY